MNATKKLLVLILMSKLSSVSAKSSLALALDMNTKTEIIEIKFILPTWNTCFSLGDKVMNGAEQIVSVSLCMFVPDMEPQKLRFVVAKALRSFQGLRGCSLIAFDQIYS